MAGKTPAWSRLVSEGYCETREEAERWILAGKVRAGSQAVTSTGQPIAVGDTLLVRGANQRYVAKGGLKLEGALAAFGIDVSGRVCLDAGASTGGFTDCLIHHGAALVYAVDVGFGQLHGSLRQNPAVINLERTNIGDEKLLMLNPAPTLGTMDLSYLSLRKAVPIFCAAQRGQGDLLCLVKPLFEVDDASARRTGIIDKDAYLPLLLSLMDDLTLESCAVRGVTNSPVTGNHGTLEFFLWLSLGVMQGFDKKARRLAAEKSVEAAQKLPVYQKSKAEEIHNDD